MSLEPGINNQGEGSPVEQPHQIVWVESEDVYKPIPRSFRDFISERDILNEDKRVYIKQDALNHLIEHLRSNKKVEQGGILFGNAYQDPFSGELYIEITAAIPALATIGTSAHLDFTPDSWMGIMDYARAEHPQENIVGWYHSHPNIGVFMSGTDMNTQRAFFHHPWSLSIVCDPVKKQIGFFLGEKAVQVEPIRFWHKKDLPNPIGDNHELPKELRRQHSNRIPVVEPVLLFIILVVVVLSILTGILLFKIFTDPKYAQCTNSII